MNSSEDSNAFRLRLSLAIAESGKTKAQIAREIGETSQLLNKWLNTDQKHPPSAYYVVKLAEVLKVNLLWLITGEGSKTSNLLAPVDGSAMVEVPEYNVVFGCGETPEPTYEEVSGTVPALYRRDFFEKLGIKASHCKRVRVSGDSMEPLILDGDCILIDCSKVEKIENGAIYAIAYDHELMVKRLIKEFGRLIIKSENPAYHDVVLEAEAANHVYIIGRVIERSGAL